MAMSNGALHENLTAADLLEMKTRLDNDLKHLLDAQSAFNQESHGGELQEVFERVKTLMSQLVEESTSRSWSELRLKRIEMGKLLCNKLFMEQENTQSINNTLEKLDLAQQVMRIGKETSDLQKKLDEQNALNFKLKNENGELLGKLKESRGKSVLSPEVTRNRDYKRLKNEVEIHSQSITIYKNIIQRLVVGLGIHLDEDEELQELVEKCGEILTL